MTGAAPDFAVVLAGGVGSRFWPVSTPERPKQLLPLAGDRPLVVDAVGRASALVGSDRVRVLTGERLVEPIRRACSGLEREHFFVEPAARGTGPVLAWAARRLLEDSPEAAMISLHADHVIGPRESFVECAREALDVARERDWLCCLGRPPERPETGYGYLELGPEISEHARQVRRFVEKPDRSTARRYLESGGYWWNTGIFAWPCRLFLEEVRARSPEIGPHLELLERRGPAEGAGPFFDAVEAVSVDEGVLERSDRVGAVAARFEWDDVGTWPALARTRGTDAGGNAVVGEARLVEAADNIVWSEGEEEVTLFGVSGLVVVRAGERTLVTTREAAPRLKELLRAREDDGGGRDG